MVLGSFVLFGSRKMPAFSPTSASSKDSGVLWMRLQVRNGKLHALEMVNYTRKIKQQPRRFRHKSKIWVWKLKKVSTDCMKIQREQSPKSIAVPPTAHTGGGMWLCGVSIKCLCLYKWRHRGDFSISSYSPRYRLQRGKKGAFFNTFHNNKFWPFKELYIKNWAESSKSLWWRHLY